MLRSPEGERPALARAPWYASDPSVLTDPPVRASLTEAACARAPTSAAELARSLEIVAVRDPAAAFSFDDRGTATLAGAGRTFGAGRFTLPTLAELRDALPSPTASRPARARLSVLVGADVLTDIGTLQATAPEGVVFQVASQFNCLEAPSARVVPVSAYVTDPTQGPRASISALPGTLLRHHAAPGPGGQRFTQTDARCLNLLADVLDPAVAEVRSGYLSTDSVHDLPAAAAALTDGFDRLRIGLHEDVEVVLGHAWDGAVRPGTTITQVFTSTIALGSYGRDDGSRALVEARRQLLRAAYVGTLFAAASLGKHTVVLTLIGGGVFGNPHEAIWEAIHFALGQLDEHASTALHVIVNTRAELAPADLSEVRARGGHVARFSRERVSVEGATSTEGS